MIATDPLSIVFLGCATISGVFVVISTATGLGHGHLVHLGHAPLHLGHIGHAGAATHTVPGAHAGHGAQVTQVTHGQAADNGHALSTQSAGVPAPAHPWATLGETLVGGLNLFSILTLLFCFGLFGYLFHNLTNLGDVLSIVFPALLGSGAGIGVGALMRRLFEAESGVLTLEDARLEGRIGKVSLLIRPGGVGEVIYKRVGGGRQSIGARSLDPDPLPIDTDIVIVSMRDGIAEVQSWESFLRSNRLGTAAPLQTLEPGPPAAPELPAPTEPAP